MMERLWLAFLGLILATKIAEAQAHHKGTLSSLNLGIRYSSLIEKRGVIFYRDFQIDPVVGVFFFDDKLEYLGDSIGYRDFIWDDVVRFRSRLVAISDKPLFPAYAKIREGYPRREDTYEWSNQVEIFFPGYNSSYQGELDLSFSKDIARTHGSYAEAQGKFRLFAFNIPGSGLIEANAYGSIGFGDKRNNRYFYGPDGNQDGFNNSSYGIWFAFPDQADRYYPIIQLRHFQVSENFRDSTYAKGRNNGWLFSFIATEGVL